MCLHIEYEVNIMKKGLIHIYCGDGKGKTTAAMGLAIRAAGREKKVFITQFLKSGKSGELVSLDKLKDYVTFLPGKPVNKFIWNMNDEEKKDAKKEHTSRFREIVEIIKKNEYDLLIYVANWPIPRRLAWDTLLRARALENQCYVCGVNRVGIDGYRLKYNGGSKIYSALGEEAASVPDETEGIATATLHLTALHQFREKFPVWKDADEFQLRHS